MRWGERGVKRLRYAFLSRSLLLFFQVHLFCFLWAFWGESIGGEQDKEGRKERETHTQSKSEHKNLPWFLVVVFFPHWCAPVTQQWLLNETHKCKWKKVSAKKATTTKMMIFKIVNEHKRIPRCLICSTVCKRLAKEKTLAHIVSSTIAWWLRMTGQVAWPITPLGYTARRPRQGTSATNSVHWNSQVREWTRLDY